MAIMIYNIIVLSILVALFIISFLDSKTREISNYMILLLLALNIALVFFDYIIFWDKIVTFICSVIIMSIIYYWSERVNKKSIGGGDIKLVAVLSLGMGFYRTILFVLFYSILIIIIAIKGVKNKIPMSPLITISYLISNLIWFFIY